VYFRDTWRRGLRDAWQWLRCRLLKHEPDGESIRWVSERAAVWSCARCRNTYVTNVEVGATMAWDDEARRFYAQLKGWRR